MSQDIVIVTVGNQPRVDSRTIAARLEVQHKNLLSLLDDYKADFKEFGRVAFETLTLPTNGGVQKTRFAQLTEDQAYLLLTYTKNTAEARDCKKALVHAFKHARDHKPALQTYNDPLLMQLEIVRQLRQDQLNLEDRTVALELAMEATSLNSVEVNQIYRLGQTVAKCIGGKYHVVWHEFKTHFQLASYRDLPRSKFLEGIAYLRDWYESIREGDDQGLLGERAA